MKKTKTTTKEDLEELLIEKHQEKLEVYSKERLEMMHDWINSVHDLFNDIKIWMSDYIANGYLEWNEEEIEIDEPGVLPYKIKSISMNLGVSDVITITPEYRFIIGGDGRLAMTNHKGKFITLIRKIQSDGKSKWFYFTNVRKITKFEPTFIDLDVEVFNELMIECIKT